MLEREPRDSFLLYGVAMEYKRDGEGKQAIAYFTRVIEVDPNHCYAYYQRGQAQEQQGDLAAARQSYLDGIAAAVRAGDTHAQSELQAALQMLG